MDQINKYCQGLIKLPSHISESKHVISFFSALPGDVLLPPYVVGAVQHSTHVHIMFGPRLVFNMCMSTELTKDDSIICSQHSKMSHNLWGVLTKYVLPVPLSVPAVFCVYRRDWKKQASLHPLKVPTGEH